MLLVVDSGVNTHNTQYVPLSILFLFALFFAPATEGDNPQNQETNEDSYNYTCSGALSHTACRDRKKHKGFLTHPIWPPFTASLGILSASVKPELFFKDGPCVSTSSHCAKIAKISLIQALQSRIILLSLTSYWVRVCRCYLGVDLRSPIL